jgi:hypothetical protein
VTFAFFSATFISIWDEKVAEGIPKIEARIYPV